MPDEQRLTELAHELGIVAPLGKPGTMIIFDCNVMHGSNGNITPFPRANVFLVYNALSNRLQAPFGSIRPAGFHRHPRTYPHRAGVRFVD